MSGWRDFDTDAHQARVKAIGKPAARPELQNVGFVAREHGAGMAEAPTARAPVTALHAPESLVLRAVLEALRLHPRVAWAARINSGRFQVEGRWITASFTGCADILGQLKTGELLACECKSDTGRTTAEQAAFLQAVSDNNGIAFVARSVDDVMRALETKEAA